MRRLWLLGLLGGLFTPALAFATPSCPSAPVGSASGICFENEDSGESAINVQSALEARPPPVNAADCTAASGTLDNQSCIEPSGDLYICLTAPCPTPNSWVASAVGSGISALLDDPSPQLGADLDLNGHALDFPTTKNIADVTNSTSLTDSSTDLATTHAIKNYVDDNDGPIFAATCDTAGEVVVWSSAGNVACSSITAAAGSNSLVVPANTSTGQCTTLKEGSTNGSDTTGICAPDSIDPTDTNYAPGVILDPGVNTPVWCFRNADATGLGATECTAGMRSSTVVATTNVEDTRLGLFGLRDGNPELFLFYNGNGTAGDSRVVLLDDGIGSAEISDAICTQWMSRSIDLVAGTVEYYSLNRVDLTTGRALSSTTEGDVDEFSIPLSGGSVIIPGLTALFDVAQGADQSCAISIQDDGTSTITATANNAASAYAFTPSSSISLSSKLNIKADCSASSVSTIAEVSWCMTPD